MHNFDLTQQGVNEKMKIGIPANEPFIGQGRVSYLGRSDTQGGTQEAVFVTRAS